MFCCPQQCLLKYPLWIALSISGSLLTITMLGSSSLVLPFDSGKKGNCLGSPTLEVPAPIYPSPMGQIRRATVRCLRAHTLLRTARQHSEHPQPLAPVALDPLPRQSCLWHIPSPQKAKKQSGYHGLCGWNLDSQAAVSTCMCWRALPVRDLAGCRKRTSGRDIG